MECDEGEVERKWRNLVLRLVEGKVREVCFAGEVGVGETAGDASGELGGE